MKGQGRMAGQDHVWELRALSTELRALGYLIQNQSNDLAPPLDSSEIRDGLASLLTRMGKRVKRLSVRLEREELRRESESL